MDDERHEDEEEGWQQVEGSRSPGSVGAEDQGSPPPHPTPKEDDDEGRSPTRRHRVPNYDYAS